MIKIFIENAEALRADFELTEELTDDDFYAYVRRPPEEMSLQVKCSTICAYLGKTREDKGEWFGMICL